MYFSQEYRNRIFPQMLADAYLSGAFGLQGNDINLTASYLIQFLAEQDPLPPELASLSSEIDGLMRVSQEIKTLIARKDRNEVMRQNLNKLASSIAHKIADWSEDGALLLPSGWNNENNIDSHAMVVRIHKKGLNYIVDFINSGSGLEKYHAKYETHQKALKQNILRYTFPAEHFNLTVLTQFLNQLLSLHCRPLHPRPLNASNLYEKVVPLLGDLDGKLTFIDPSTPYLLTSGQLSGACAQRVWHQVLKIYSEDLDKYCPLMLKWNMKALKDLYQSMQGRLTDPGTHYLLTASTRHVLRMLHENEQRLPDAALKTALFADLQNYLVILRDNQPIQVKVKPRVIQVTPPLFTHQLQATSIHQCSSILNPYAHPDTARPVIKITDQGNRILN